MNKILLVDKPEGVSSYFCIKKVKKLFDTTKVGHCGTLDPFASGLLIILVNEATKISNYILEDKKEYIATLKLGETTKTFDTEGEVCKTMEVPNLTEDDVRKCLDSFIGKQKQTPPIYSAIKVHGMKLYEYARLGEEVEIKDRDIEIFEMELISFKDNIITFRCLVSKGTYIRSLAVDIASRLNTIGYLIGLRRTRVGNISIDQAKKIPDLMIEDGIDIKDILEMKKVQVKYELVKNGEEIKLENINDNLVLLIDENNLEIAIYEKCDDIYKCKRGFVR